MSETVPRCQQQVQGDGLVVKIEAEGKRKRDCERGEEGEGDRKRAHAMDVFLETVEVIVCFTGSCRLLGLMTAEALAMIDGLGD